MNIKNFFLLSSQKNDEYTSSLRRSTAAAIDVWITLFLRVIVMQFLGLIWLNKELVKFIADFRNEFGTETVKNTPEHINFLLHHQIFIYSLIFYGIVILVGAFYHAYFNSSSWQGTVGKRMMKIVITKENGLPISLKRGFLHYFLSVLPFAFLIYLVGYQVNNNLSFYQAIIGSDANLVLGFIFIAWVQIHLFNKKKSTAYDLICNTVLRNGKTNSKWPWSKN